MKNPERFDQCNSGFPFYGSTTMILPSPDSGRDGRSRDSLSSCTGAWSKPDRLAFGPPWPPCTGPLDGASRLPSDPLDELLARRGMVGEVAFLVYFFVGADSRPLDRSTRLRKGDEALVRALGFDVLSSFAILDFELPPPGDDQREEFRDWVRFAGRKMPELEHPHARYFTRDAARMIWRLEAPIRVEKAHAHAELLATCARDAGLECRVVGWDEEMLLPYGQGGGLDPELRTDPKAPRLPVYGGGA